MDLNIAYTGMDIGQQQVQELVVKCAPSMPLDLMTALVKRESAYKQYAIGMDTGYGRVKQPTTLEEAKNTIAKLEKEKKKFSIGLAQIHISNVSRYKLSLEQAFTPCISIHTGELIFNDFYKKAKAFGYKGHSAIFAALRGYNSGNINNAVSNNYASAIMKNAAFDISEVKVRNWNTQKDEKVKVASEDHLKDLSGDNNNVEVARDDIFRKENGRLNDFFSNGKNRTKSIFN